MEDSSILLNFWRPLLCCPVPIHLFFFSWGQIRHSQRESEASTAVQEEQMYSHHSSSDLTFHLSSAGTAGVTLVPDAEYNSGRDIIFSYLIVTSQSYDNGKHFYFLNWISMYFRHKMTYDALFLILALLCHLSSILYRGSVKDWVCSFYGFFMQLPATQCQTVVRTFIQMLNMIMFLYVTRWWALLCIFSRENISCIKMSFIILLIQMNALRCLKRFHQLQQERRHGKAHDKFLQNIAAYVVLQFGLTPKCRLTWIQLREMSFLLSPNRRHPACYPLPAGLRSVEVWVGGILRWSP